MVKINVFFSVRFSMHWVTKEKYAVGDQANGYFEEAS